MKTDLCPRTRTLLEEISRGEVFVPGESNDMNNATKTYDAFRSWMGNKLQSANSKGGAAILPYREVYGKGIRFEHWSTMFAGNKARYAIQLPAGTLGIKNDQPIAFVYSLAPTSSKVLFIDATQAPRASEHANVLSEAGAEMLKVAIKSRSSTGSIWVAEHDFGGNQPPYMNGLPTFSKLVPRASDTARTDESYTEDIQRLKDEIEKLRTRLRCVLD